MRFYDFVMLKLEALCCLLKYSLDGLSVSGWCVARLFGFVWFCLGAFKGVSIYL